MTDPFDTDAFGDPFGDDFGDPFALESGADYGDPFAPAEAERAAPAIDMAQLMTGLNPRQQEAVESTQGPVLVVAGAGTGKTRVLTTRIAYILARELARPEEVLAVTFTNKAAGEMRHRLADMVGPDAKRLRMGSFHSVSMQMLRCHAEAAGLASGDFQILDEDDQRTLFTGVLEQLGHKPGKSKKEWTQKIKRLHQLVVSFKEEGWTPEDARRKFSARTPDDAPALDAYPLYCQALVSRNACDFADLLLHMVRLFRERPEIKARWSEQFRYVLVDEVQDTNQLQYEWLEHLARGHSNLCCVGDPDQALYQWRGARPDLLLNFAEDWPGTHTVVLERNYRSTQPILDVANRVVAINPRPAPKTLESGSAGDPVEFNEYATSWDEAQQMSDDIAQRVRGGQDPREIAILVRSQRVMLQIEKALNARGVSYQVVGGQKFFAREEIRDLNAYIRLAHDTRDSLALQRIANKPVRGLGPKAVDQVIATFEAGYGDLVEALREVAANGRRITQSAADGMNRLAWLVEQANAKAREGINPGELMTWLIEETDYVAWRRSSGDESWRDRGDNLRELAADAGEYRSIGSYLQQVAIMSAADASDDTRTVRLSTVHAAKGLEFETVFTPALENGVLPNAASLREHYGPAEERRICHVAWTRAKQELIVSFAQSRLGQAAEPSPFLFDAGLMDTARKGSGPRSAVMRQSQGRPQTPRPVKPGSYYDQAARSGETSRQSGIGLRGFHKRPKRTAS